MEERTISKYDRAYGGLKSGNHVHTNPSTIEWTQPITGETETFIVQTFRSEQGDFVALKFIDTGTTRLILPPKVCNVIMSQRDSLTTRRRKASSKAAAQARKERGELPGFMRNPGKSKKRKT